jgi:hypothetical protein
MIKTQENGSTGNGKKSAPKAKKTNQKQAHALRAGMAWGLWIDRLEVLFSLISFSPCVWDGEFSS